MSDPAPDDFDDRDPHTKFCDELDELIERRKEAPMDDRLTYAQIIGTLEFVKHKLLDEILHIALAAEDDDE